MLIHIVDWDCDPICDAILRTSFNLTWFESRYNVKRPSLTLSITASCRSFSYFAMRTLPEVSRIGNCAEKNFVDDPKAVHDKGIRLRGSKTAGVILTDASNGDEP